MFHVGVVLAKNLLDHSYYKALQQIELQLFEIKHTCLPPNLSEAVNGQLKSPPIKILSVWQVRIESVIFS